MNQRTEDPERLRRAARRRICTTASTDDSAPANDFEFGTTAKPRPHALPTGRSKSIVKCENKIAAFPTFLILAPSSLNNERAMETTNRKSRIKSCTRSVSLLIEECEWKPDPLFDNSWPDSVTQPQPWTAEVKCGASRALPEDQQETWGCRPKPRQAEPA